MGLLRFWRGNDWIWFPCRDERYYQIHDRARHLLHAVIQTAHTRDNAIEFCREYAYLRTRSLTNASIEELSVRLNDAIYADCPRGLFTDFGGDKFQFRGKESVTPGRVWSTNTSLNEPYGLVKSRMDHQQAAMMSTWKFFGRFVRELLRLPDVDADLVSYRNPPL